MKIDTLSELDEDTLEPILVAVYGTLKIDGSNHRLLSGSKLIGTGSTLPEYALKSMGGFPSIIKGKDKVKVEVYKIEPHTLSSLDRLEGYPSFYNRKKVKIALDSDSTKLAWMYFVANPSTIESRPNYTVKDDQDRLDWRYSYD